MRQHTKASEDRMGQFNNAIVAAIDKCELAPAEVLLVLRQLENRINSSFEKEVMLDVQSKKVG